MINAWRCQMRGTLIFFFILVFLFALNILINYDIWMSFVYFVHRKFLYKLVSCIHLLDPCVFFFFKNKTLSLQEWTLESQKNCKNYRISIVFLWLFFFLSWVLLCNDLWHLNFLIFGLRMPRKKSKYNSSSSSFSTHS